MPDQTIQAKIRTEIYRAFVALGADRELLATMGSWGDTLNDEEVLELLRNWNDAPFRKSS